MGHIHFHLAFPVSDLEETKRFYLDGLGCRLGRESKGAVILDIRGTQLVAHVTTTPQAPQKGIYPRHFGLVCTDRQDWQVLVDRAREKGLTFYQEPRVRFPGTRIEHHTFFLEDPSHNLLEFKHYTYESAIFGEQAVSNIGDAD